MRDPVGVNHGARVFRHEIECSLALCEGIGSTRALTVALMIKYGEWEQLMDLKIDASHYDDHGLFADDYLVTSVLQKNPRVPLSVPRSEVAIRKFYDAEALCGRTNARIQDFIKNQHSADFWSVKLVSRVQHIIQRILSAYPKSSDLEFAERNMRFGPGATTSLSGVVTQGAKYNKGRTLDCTSSLVGFRAFCFPDLWKAHVTDLNVRNFSKLTTVPKNAKTDRVICIEPDLNIFVQLGIGALLREKLRLFGLDLLTQEKNQELASQAHRRSLATVDLSAASDTISQEVVSLLLPPAWVELLELARVPETRMPDGTHVKLEKWSSMGNGYTFELETLIFYATLLAVVDEGEWFDVTAYGDDCILPSSYVESFERALNFLGFKVNDEKTFGKGLFYESCGTDWFNGHNVRPFFFRSEHHDFESICYLYANNARRWANRRNGGWSCDARCLPLWLRCFTAVAPKDAHHIPEGYGDVGFTSDFDRARPILKRPKGGWGGYRFSYRRIAAVEAVVSQSGAYLSFLNGNFSDFSLGREALRGRYRRPCVALGHSFEWPNLGPWL